MGHYAEANCPSIPFANRLLKKIIVELEPSVETDAAPTYAAYLVRIWQDGSDVSCRASATAVQDGETVHFATLQALFAFLQARAAPARPPHPDPT